MITVLIALTGCGGDDMTTDTGGNDTITVEGQTFSVTSAFSTEGELDGKAVTIITLSGMDEDDLSTLLTSSVYYYPNDNFAAASVSIGTLNPRIYSFSCKEESDETYKVESPNISFSGGKISVQETFKGCVANADGSFEGPFDLVVNVTNL